MRRRTLFLIAGLTMIGLSLLVMPDGPGCQVSAHHDTTPSDFCYTFNVTITNTSAGTLTDYAVRVPINASGLIGAGQLDEDISDVQPILGSYTQDVDLLAQDVTSATAGWWFHVPSIANGQSRTVTVYFGKSSQLRDQGVLFTGSDVVSSAHHADYNISDNLTLNVTLEHLTGTAMNATLASHWSANTGYRLLLVNSSGLKIRGQVNAATCDVSWNSAWTDERVVISMTFANPTLAIAVDGVTQNSCNTGLGSITGVSTTFDVGTSLTNAIINGVRLQSAGASKLHWEFNPSSMAETSAVNPTYTGTVTDESANSHPGTYTFTRTQTGLSYSVGSTNLRAAASIPPPPTAIADVIGDNVFGVGIGATATPEVTGDAFYVLTAPVIDAFTGPRTMAWTAFFVVAALGFMLIAFMLFKYIPLAVFFGGIPLIYGMAKGYLPAWVVILWGLFTIAAWFAVRRGEQSS